MSCDWTDRERIAFLFEGLAREETARFTAHLFSCPRCRDAYERDRRVLKPLSLLGERGISQKRRNTVLAAAGRRIQTRRLRRLLVAPAAIAASLLLITSFIINNLQLPGIKSTPTALAWEGDLDDRLHQLDGEIAMLTASLSQTDEMYLPGTLPASSNPDSEIDGF